VEPAYEYLPAGQLRQEADREADEVVR